MNFNKILLGGNLTRAPELKTTASGKVLAKFGLAVNEHYTSNGEKKERTLFIDVTAWGRTAEVICKYLTKGDPIFIDGRLEFQRWEDPTGAKRSKHEVVVEKFQFVGGKRDSETIGADGLRKDPTPDADEVPF